MVWYLDLGAVFALRSLGKQWVSFPHLCCVYPAKDKGVGEGVMLQWDKEKLLIHFVCDLNSGPAAIMSIPRSCLLDYWRKLWWHVYISNVLLCGFRKDISGGGKVTWTFNDAHHQFCFPKPWTLVYPSIERAYDNARHKNIVYLSHKGSLWCRKSYVSSTAEAANEQNCCMIYWK